jgi:D-sedoheptulose 7-phosphate isomerase
LNVDYDRIKADHLRVVEEVFGPQAEALEALARKMTDCLKAGGKIMLCGNGGSAADAQHFAAELVNRFEMNRRPYAAVALSADTSILTSCANDFCYEEVFAKQVAGLGRPGDLLIAISTSGNSKNVLRAAEAAQEKKIGVVAFTGGSGGRLAAQADFVLNISCTGVTARVQEGHELYVHLLSGRIEELMEESE